MITYHYVFKNPIGSSWDFAADWNTTLGTAYKYDYVSAIPLREDDNLDPAEILHFRDGVWLFEDDTPVSPANYEAIPVAIFACTPTETVRVVDGTPKGPYTQVQQYVVESRFSAGGSTYALIPSVELQYHAYTGPFSIHPQDGTGTHTLAYLGVVVQDGDRYTGYNYFLLYPRGSFTVTLDFAGAPAIYYYWNAKPYPTVDPSFAIVSTVSTNGVSHKRSDTSSTPLTGTSITLTPEDSKIDALPAPGTLPQASAMFMTMNRLI